MSADDRPVVPAGLLETLAGMFQLERGMPKNDWVMMEVVRARLESQRMQLLQDVMGPRASAVQRDQLMMFADAIALKNERAVAYAQARARIEAGRRHDTDDFPDYQRFKAAEQLVSNQLELLKGSYRFESII